MKKSATSGNIFETAKRFTDTFFDGLKNNAIDSVLAKSKKAAMEREAIAQMEKNQREKEELDKILESIPVAGSGKTK